VTKVASSRQVAVGDIVGYHSHQGSDLGVFATTNGGVTWKEVTGNLRGKNLRTVEVVKTGIGTVVLVGGLGSLSWNDPLAGGVYRAIDPVGRDTRWTELGTDLPNALVMDLRYVPSHVAGAVALGRIVEQGQSLADRHDRWQAVALL
jgi:hypothetical protein